MTEETGRDWVPKLELPTGGGALAPVGEKVEAIAFTGAAAYQIPIPTSPARGDAQPQLALTYSSGGGNGPFGTGWSLGLPAISRRTERELPEYADGRESDTFVLAGIEDLVPLLDADGERVVQERPDHLVYPYRPRVETLFARIERWVRRTDGDTHWRVTTTDNLTSWYGLDPQARLADPEDPARVFSWLVERTADDRGNVVVYEYKAEEPELNRGPLTNRYLKRVHYGNRTPHQAGDWLFEVVFDYGEHDASPVEAQAWPSRADAFSTFRAGFDVRTRRLCRRVLMFHRFPGELSSEVALVRSTDFEYDDAAHLAKLARVTQRWYEPNPDGGLTVAGLPPTEFGYTEARIVPELHEFDPRDLAALPYGVDGDRYRLVDLDGEGLPGIVAQIGDDLHYQSPAGGGRFRAQRVLPVQTTTADLGEDGQFVDVDGDGRPELVRTGGFYSRADDGAWSGYASFAQMSTLDPAAPGVRQVDLDANGLPDLLVSYDDHFVWVPSLGVAGYGPARLIGKPTDERAGPAVAFDDPTGTVFLADMTGDGLQDIVRIDNGAVHYWPNLGRGRFGRRIAMHDAPGFAAIGEFDPRRVRLADIDGSGTTDIVYLDQHGARAWLNLSGNGFGPPTPIRPYPGVAATTAVDVVDLLGKGTACLLWSEPSGWAKPGNVRYLDLMGDKPHLLVSIDNNLGLQTRVRYEPSTAQYLRDRDASRPWMTRLPFPVYVATRVEHYDAPARRHTVQLASYHHGYFDAVEQEFHGFARVDRWDTESFDDFNADGLFALELFDTVEADLHQPPVLTRSWFHTGAFVGADRISRQLALEYWSGDPAAWPLPDTVLPAGLSPDESREAVRALRGRPLREEVYASDGSAQADIPYTVTESNATVRLLQPSGRDGHAVFHVHDRETLAYHYERDATDPRIGHDLVLAVDEHGNVTRSASAAYPRRAAPLDRPEQGARAIVCAEQAYAAVDEPDAYRAGVLVATRSHEVIGFDAAAPLAVDGLDAAILGATRQPPETVQPPDDGSVHLRLLSATRLRYYADDLSGPLPAGACGIRALPFEEQAAAFSDGQVAAVYGTDVDGALLGEAGYAHDEALWWTRSPRPESDPARFFLPVHVLDPFGNPPTVIEYDEPALFAVRVTDPAGNATTTEIDYRVLAPRLTIDPNGNRTGVTFDTRGMVVATYVMGRPGSGLGDSPADPTTVVEYDPFAWLDRGEPTVAHVSSRETHGDPQTRWTERFTYRDGTGNVLLEKVSAEPGEAVEPRWVGTGRVVLDNKGNAVKQYEPYFADTPAFEPEAEFREQGVSPVFRYDPAGRLVRTDLPNGTFSRTEITPWLLRAHDVNDTVAGSAWHAARIGGALGPPEQRAAELTAAHADTPTVTHLDHLGREFLVDRHAGFDASEPPVATILRTRQTLDLAGNVLAVVDARDNLAETRVYGLLGQVLVTDSPDAGWRRSLAAADGAPLRDWNARGFTSRLRYDALRRSVEQFVTPPGEPEILVARTVWGEDLPAPEDGNHRTRVFRQYDSAGAVTFDAYDFKGNVARHARQLVGAYRSTVDWSASGDEVLGDPIIVANTYDAANRVVLATAPDGSQTRNAYNEAGLIESVHLRLPGADTEESILSDVDYNARGQRVRCGHGNGAVTGYEYDPLTFAPVRQRTERDGGATVLQDLRYTYDPVGNITEIRDGAQQPVFFAGSVVSADQRFVYDPLYRLVEATGREHAFQYEHQRDAADVEPAVGIPFPNSPEALQRYVERYTYDSTGNLLSLSHVGGDVLRWRRCYQYAVDGNRLLATGGPGEPPGPCPAHHVVAPSLSQRCEYDAHGNMTAMAHLPQLGWDHADRLRASARQVRLDGGTPETTHYSYDGTGERVRKVTDRTAGPGEAPARRAERIYLGAFEVYREYAGDGVTVTLERTTLHVSDGERRVAQYDRHTLGTDAPAVIRRFQFDNQVGSVALEVDEQARVISYEEFHPYGTTAYLAGRSAAEVGLKRYRYTGKERDTETDLSRHGERYYATWLGRWTAPDPIGIEDSVNRYAYVDGNPVAYLDPGGTSKVTRQQVIARVQAQMNAEADAGMYKDRDTYNQVLDARLKAELALHGYTPSQAKPPRPQVTTARDSYGVELEQRMRRQADQKAGRAYDADRAVRNAVQQSGEWAAEVVQRGLDGLGLVPGLGEPFDLLSGGISLLRGDLVGAGASAGAAVPFFGWAGVAVKYSDEGAGIVNALNKTDEAADMCAKCLNQDVPANPRNLPIDPATGKPEFHVWEGALKRWKVTAGETSDGINDKLRSEVQDYATRRGTIDGPRIPDATGKEVHAGHDWGEAWILTPPKGKSHVRAQTAKGNQKQSKPEKKEAERRRANGGGYARPKGAKRR